MRMSRMKVPEGVDGLYHCYSRAVDGKYIFGRKEKTKFLQMMWSIGDFLGVNVMDFVLMDNHYHQIVFVPGIIELTNEELLARLRNYYGETSHHYRKFLAAMEKGDKSPNILRGAYTRHMGNLSEFEKRLKQGFSQWYNTCRNRKGTLWMGRFGSTITEDQPQAAMAMAAYGDLNPVRAGLVDDPKDYPYSGYAFALAGNPRCQAGLTRLLRSESWEVASKIYRLFLVSKGHTAQKGKPGRISRQVILKTLKAKGELSISELLRLKARYFTCGLAFGSEEFVEELFQQFRSHFGERRKTGARAIKVLSDSNFHVIRALKKNVLS